MGESGEAGAQAWQWQLLGVQQLRIDLKSLINNDMHSNDILKGIQSFSVRTQLLYTNAAF